MEEIWKDIDGAEGKYQVSNLGNVKSMAREFDCGTFTNRVKERILSPAKDRSGYMRCALSINKKLVTFKVHRLVADAFHEKSIKDMTIDHLNGEKTDNRISNLDVVTRSENVRRSFANGQQPSRNGVLNGMAKLTQGQADMIREIYSHPLNQGCKKGSKPFSTRWISRAFAINRKTITNIVNGRAYKSV